MSHMLCERCPSPRSETHLILSWGALSLYEEKPRNADVFDRVFVNGVIPSVRCGWYGSIDQFLVLHESPLLQYLEAHHLKCMLEPPSASQIGAWKHCFVLL